jgi:hypothetical protein
VKSREFNSGRWVRLATPAQLKAMIAGAHDVWDTTNGATGWKYVLNYERPSTTGPWDDAVCELLTMDEVIQECRERIRHTAAMLKYARQHRRETEPEQ